MDSATDSRRAYWLCQFAGWGLYTLYILMFAVASDGFRFGPIVCIVVLLAVVCPLVTHAWRIWMRRHGWLLLPNRQLLPRLALMVAALSIAFTAVTFFLQIVVLGAARWDAWWPGAAVGMTAGYGMAFGGWLWIYFIVLARRRRRATELRALQLEVAAHDAKLRALESQLNPHFLFNCLNSVRALIVENPSSALTMVTKLAELLRYSLQPDQADTISLEEELRAVNDYLRLEQIRFEERLAFDVKAGPGTLGVRVPRMMVLTLVENAVTHGISRLPAGGTVMIDARIAGGDLRIDVSNSGSLARGVEGVGLGLRNARERLRLLYGASASLTITATDKSQVLAALALPASEAA